MEIVKDRAVSALIDFAADLLEVHGWAVGELWADTPKNAEIDVNPGLKWPEDMAPVRDGEYTGGAMCTEGALRAADLLIHTDVLYPAQTDAFTDAFHSCRLLLPDFDMGGLGNTKMWKKRPTVAMWNDHACTDRETAVAFLRDCAIKTRPDETRGVHMPE